MFPYDRGTPAGKGCRRLPAAVSRRRRIILLADGHRVRAGSIRTFRGDPAGNPGRGSHGSGRPLMRACGRSGHALRVSAHN